MRLIVLFTLCCLASTVMGATPVTTRPLAELVIHPEFSAPAKVESLNDSRLSAELMARIAAIRVRVGDRVKAGDPLVALDCRSHQSQLASQQAVLTELRNQLGLSTSQLKRARRLKATQSIGEEQLEQRQTELAVLKAKYVFQEQRIVQSQIEVAQCEIRAPFDGVVTARLAQQGELAAPGTPLLRLQQLDTLEISASLRPDQDPGESAAVEFEYQGRRYPITLRRLLPVVDARTRTREARFEFAADSAPPGAAGRVIWQAGVNYLPAHLLVQRYQNNQLQLGVMLLESGRVQFYPIPDAVEGQIARIELDAGTLVIVDGRQRVSDGDEVVDQTDDVLVKDGAERN